MRSCRSSSSCRLAQPGTPGTAAGGGGAGASGARRGRRGATGTSERWRAADDTTLGTQARSQGASKWGLESPGADARGPLTGPEGLDEVVLADARFAREVFDRRLDLALHVRALPVDVLGLDDRLGAGEALVEGLELGGE